MTEKVKLIIGMISNEQELFKTVLWLLQRRFGEVDFVSPILNFDHTTYYNKEMGNGLKRNFLSFKKLIKLSGIEKVKLLTSSIEKRFLRYGRRRINIDPGYVELSKLVLLTRKDYSHRVYLGRGVYAEATLHFKNGTFNAWEWTYPDYKTKEYINIFNEIRNIYKEQKK